ncbi:MAG: hypothetical protein WCI39_07680 [Gallionellaceae bacterium]
MSLRFQKQHKYPSQQGAALMVMLVIMVIGTAAFLVSALSKVPATLQNDQKTLVSLTQAKEALLAYAASQGDITGTGRPGDLPCPDTNTPGTANDGIEAGSCVAGAIGRLPWRTLGIPELLDADGEPLWYAISGDFRRDSLNGNPINSDLTGTLNVYGSDGTTLLTNASDMAAAIVFAPGKIVGSQLRSSSTDKTNKSNYLDSYTFPSPISVTLNNATTNGPFLSAEKTDTFNDKLIFIKASQLRPAIETRVARELAKLFNSYYLSWNSFPFAVQFTDPSNATFIGNTNTTYGLPPYENMLGGTNTPTWSAAPTISFSNGGSGSTCTLRNASNSSCTGSNCVGARCTLSNLQAGSTLQITGTLNSIGLGFWRLYDPTVGASNSSCTQEVCARNSSNSTYYAASNLLDNVSITGSLNSTGNATITFRGTVRSNIIPNRIQFNTGGIPAFTLPSWFNANNWQELLYYATSAGYAPGGNHSCAPSCLMLDNHAASAVLIATSGSLDFPNNPHPSGTLSDYLESNNASPALGIFKNKPASNSFNDKAISIAP